MFWKEKYISEMKYILVYQIALHPRASDKGIKQKNLPFTCKKDSFGWFNCTQTLPQKIG